MPSTRLHLTGPSGAGTSTLGRVLAERLGCPWHDTDDFFWLPTEPPFQTPRPAEERLALLRPRLEGGGAWILSGSLSGWGDAFIPLFDMVVFLWLPWEIRRERLEERERRRYGDAVLPGGPQHEASQTFLAWAAQYDAGGLDMRSRARHEQWLAGLPCPVLRLEGDRSVEERVVAVMGKLKGMEGG